MLVQKLREYTPRHFKQEHLQLLRILLAMAEEMTTKNFLLEK